ncbi:hypothetical protein [Paenibacillus tianjinensis]|uniref:DUF4145 domain-containing protein n=1 Tax=Paenibacillus tianjinensis TaxID=2810347 RepID=A0ABX7L7L5_9BACL|nr:hypothetical protein [Paenibacillus tianjinensis]QSF42673.1 hypothetical protein JRJ22_15255 [Paenibacillus tianjinensis]
MTFKGIGISEEWQKTAMGFSNAYTHINKINQLALSPAFEMARRLGEVASSIKIPNIEIPKFQFPKLLEVDWEEFYENFSEECKSNAKYGWCISSCMPFAAYRKIGRTEDRQEVRDDLFTKMFEENNHNLYEEEKDYIINESSGAWSEFYRQCFDSVENNNIMVAIPSLVMAVEHELTNGNDADISGKPLVRSVQSTLVKEKEQGKLASIIAASLFTLLENGIFERGITGPRAQLINRNRILHGRDDPSKWTKIDAYRLISIISTLKLLQNYE